MAAFFLFPRVLFVELLDFYRFQNTRFYLYILSLFAIRLFIGQALARGRKRKNFKAGSRQGRIRRNACKIRRARLQKTLRSGDAGKYLTLRAENTAPHSLFLRGSKRDGRG